jgi:nucleoid DNA-binding protein
MACRYIPKDERMKTRELISAISIKNRVSEETAEKELAHVFDTIKDTLKTVDYIDIKGFGCFTAANREIVVGKERRRYKLRQINFRSHSPYKKWLINNM